MLKAKVRKVLLPLYACHARLYSDDSRGRIRDKDLYSILGVHPKSTHKQIKSAYYKLSMIFHPDKNESLEAAEKFKEITQAYEVLGNYESRKKYDRKILIPTVIYESSGRSKSFDGDDVAYETFTKKPRFTGRSPIYDFDEYYRMHYGRTLQEDLYRRREREFYQNTKKYAYEREMTVEKMERFFVGCAIACALLNILIFVISDYDIPVNSKIEDPEE